MKNKILSVVLSFAALLTFASCGGKESDKSAAEIADAIYNEQDFTDSLNALDSDMVHNYYRIDESAVAEAKVYVSATFSTAEEIAVFKAADKDGVDKIEDAIDMRLEDLTLAFQDYVPGEMDKINDPVRVVKGKTVVLVLTDNYDAVSGFVEDLLNE